MIDETTTFTGPADFRAEVRNGDLSLIHAPSYPLAQVRYVRLSGPEARQLAKVLLRAAGITKAKRKRAPGTAETRLGHLATCPAAARHMQGMPCIACGETP